jgi:hypothetical protein
LEDHASRAEGSRIASALAGRRCLRALESVSAVDGLSAPQSGPELRTSDKGAERPVEANPPAPTVRGSHSKLSVAPNIALIEVKSRCAATDREKFLTITTVKRKRVRAAR